MKKIIVFLTSLMALGLVFTGCSSNGGTNSGDKSVVTLSVWDDITDETSYIKKFEEQNPDIDIQIVQIPADDYSQKLLSLQGTANAPDVMLLMEADYLKYIENGYLQSIKENAESTDEFDVNNFIPSIAEMMYSDDNQIYGLPWCVATQLLYYNKDMFDAAGVDYPTSDWTYADYEKAAVDLTIKDGKNVKQYGSDAITDTVVWYSMFGQYNNDKSILDKDGKFQIEQAIIDAADEELKLTKDLGVMPSPTTGSATADLFMSNTAAMTRQGSWYMSIYKDLEFKWDVAPMPAGTNDYVSLHTGFFTINKKTEKSEEAWKFMEFMLSDQGQELLMKESHNASARTDVANASAWQAPGANGPTNWEAMTESLENAEIGQGFVNRTIYDDLALKVNEYVNGTVTEDKVREEIKNANTSIK